MNNYNYNNWGNRLSKFLLFLFSLFVLIFSFEITTECEASSVNLSFFYSQARQIRTLQGHIAAQPLYRQILEELNPNDTTAATRIASHAFSPKRHDLIGGEEEKLGDGSMTMTMTMAMTTNDKIALIDTLRSFNFTPDAIADSIFLSTNSQKITKAKQSSAPLYLQPLRSGSKVPPIPTCALSCCIQLFLLSVCVPVSICEEYLGALTIESLQKLGLAFEDDDGWLVPYCHIMPIKVAKKILYFATDLHPNVLSMTTLGENCEGAVMYIGPDSLALIDHWNSKQQQYKKQGEDCGHIIDIGTGSGVQALSFASTTKNSKVTCVDINPRALRFARLNFEWNGLDEPILVLGDIREATGVVIGRENKPVLWSQLFGKPTAILSNPPFLPVPVEDDTISKRYGLFSSGDSSGEAILKRVVELACEYLDPNSGVLAIVSEFMNPRTEFETRFQTWWKQQQQQEEGCGGQAILFTNEEAIDAATYAQRRADSVDETQRWIRHLQQERITHISPGLLFVKKNRQKEKKRLEFYNEILPKTEHGSIWTPTNSFGREYTHSTLIAKKFV